MKINPQSLRRAVLIAVAVVLVVVLAVCVYQRHFAGLADRLGASGWLLFTMPGCHFCSEQTAVLGIAYPGTVVCSSDRAVQVDAVGDNREEPLCADMDGFPTWYNARTKEKRSGLQSRTDLEKMASSK